MTKRWTDERREDRFDAIDQRFDGIDRRLDGIDADIRGLRGEMNARFDQVIDRLEAMHRLMIQGGFVLIAALIGFIATQA